MTSLCNASLGNRSANPPSVCGGSVATIAPVRSCDPCDEMQSRRMPDRRTEPAPRWEVGYLPVAGPLAFGTIARNSKGSCERFSPACRWTPTQSMSPACRRISSVLPSGRVSRRCTSVSHTTTLALVISCIGVFSCGAMWTRTTMTDSFSNSSFASAGPADGGARRRARRHRVRAGARMLGPAWLRSEGQECAICQQPEFRERMLHGEGPFVWNSVRYHLPDRPSTRTAGPYELKRASSQGDFSCPG